MGKANWYDMREFLSFLDSKNDLFHVPEQVDPGWEVNGITRLGLQKHGPAIFFDRIRGADLPLVANLLATERRFFWALGIDDPRCFNKEWSKRTEQVVAPQLVDSAPCQEHVVKEADIDLDRICNVKWHQHDGGSFPGTLSASVTRDPETGLQNVGIYRMATLGKNLLGWGAPEYTHGRQHYMKYEKMGKPMPMAVITGYDPIVFVVACTRTAPDVDEFHLAGALRGEALQMVRCQTIDIEIPATSEVVFEGFVRPGLRKLEGGLGEYTGYYGEARQNPVFEITRITHRTKPIYLGAREQWYPSDSSVVVAKASQAEAYKTLRQLVPGFCDLRCDVAYEAIAQIEKLYKGHPQQVMNAIWGATYSKYKHVIVVDQDIDIWDYNSVHWALSTRVRADRDIYIVPQQSGQWLDPAVSLRERGWQAGLGIDATMPREEYEFWGEQAPRTVDDPEIVSMTTAKWGDKLKWNGKPAV
ncbi:MAG: UbiD family decarboxylase [Acidobacteria bacterium]|nr:UbiD family decarboxylase [Acidobacteriota bacterium]